MSDTTAGVENAARTVRSERRFARRIDAPSLAPENGRSTLSSASSANSHSRVVRAQSYFVRLPEPVVQPTSTSRVVVLQQWEGVIERLDGDEVVATVRDLTDSSRPDEIVTFDAEEFSDSDRALLEVGAVFYWSIGFRTQATGTKERLSRFELRRLPPLTRAQILRAEQEANSLLMLFPDDRPD